MFNKKPAEKKMKVLNEKEIQERLYGFYHRSEMVGEPKPKSEDLTQAPKAPPAQASSFFTPRALRPEVTADDRNFVDEEDDAADPVTPEISAVKSELFETETVRVERPVPQKVKAAKPQAPTFKTTSQKSTSSADAWQKIEDLINQSVTAVKKIHPAYLGGAVLAVLLVCGLIFAVQLISSSLKTKSPSTVSHQNAVKVRLEAGQSVLSPAKDSIKKEAALTPAVPEEIKATGGYSIQLCLSDNFEASKKVMESLKAKGYEGYVRKVQGGAANQLYQIFVGRFPTAQEAGAALKTLRADEEFAKYSDSFVRTAR